MEVRKSAVDWDLISAMPGGRAVEALTGVGGGDAVGESSGISSIRGMAMVMAKGTEPGQACCWLSPCGEGLQLFRCVQLS